MRISLLAIGTELLDGLVVENNSIAVSQELNKIGLALEQKMAVRDEKSGILAALNYLAQSSDIIIITGGLGPTEDDKTRECIAEFSGRKLQFDPSIIEMIKKKFSAMKMYMADENKNQAFVIEGSIVLNNPAGTAPGFIIPGRPLIASFPGVPSELAAMFPDFANYLELNFKIEKTFTSIYIRTIGLPESYLDEQLKILKKKGIVVGTIANFGQVDLRLDIPETDKNKALEIAKREMAEFPEIQNHIFSYDKNESIVMSVLKKLIAKNKKVLFAESCTGGLLSKLITDIPGSSAAFYGSLVVYDNKLKTKLLGVKEAALEKFGAVSFETAEGMLKGLKEIAEADYYLSVTGIAGPDGGTKEKPVGTIFIGFGKKDKTVLMHFRFNNQRDRNRNRTAMRVFEILWEDLTFGSLDFNHYTGLIEFRSR